MSKNINDLITKAYDSFVSKKIDLAINYLNKALLIEPLNFNALHAMGVILGSLNKHQEAKKFLKKGQVKGCARIYQTNVSQVSSQTLDRFTSKFLCKLTVIYLSG